MNRRSPFLVTTLAFGFAFLYIPILLLVIYSFNESRLVTVWSGFSTHWYGELFRDQQIIAAAKVSLLVASLTATFATVLGTMAAIVLTRFRRFRGQTLFSGMITAPMVMPEIITGLSILLMFVALEDLVGWPDGRGITTITIAHITFCMSYVTIVVRARLSQMDESVEEAAMDLGARPFKTFLFITLPIISPALLAGWLLAFTISLDDLVITSFVAGPSSSTLPMVVFSSVRLGVTPKINALATILISLATLCVLVAGWLMVRREKQRKAAMARAIAEQEQNIAMQGLTRS
ncbi:ABC transporter permease subunit [Haematospirillum sp. H1815]|uniref:ABC transporter permease subunit n=1 Tax=Haematospirillum sp. H1815 TaxID=2723108 RepID=UPI00143C9920|nr:ABC transporter permease subunit [Haematospirillum sp. H1815]NKD77936.1 ABC transporter permease subunit [Haematospirillum sp. H1815]